MNRRTLCLSFVTSVSGGLLILASCAPKGSTPAEKVAFSAKLLADALTAAVASVKTITAIPQSDLVKIEDQLIKVQVIAQQIATAASTATGSLVTQLIGAASLLLTIVTPLGLPPLVLAVFQAAVSFAPVLAADAGLSGAVLVQGPPPVFTPEKAQTILTAAAATRGV